MADLVRLGVVIDPTATQSGASSVKNEFTGIGQAAEKMQQQVSGAATKAGQSLGTTGASGTKAGSDVARGAQVAASGLGLIDPSARRAASAIAGVGDAMKGMLMFTGGGLILEGINGIVEALKSIPVEAVKSGVGFDDMVRKATVSMAAFIQVSNPKQFTTWSEALAASGDVVDVLRQKMVQYHVPMEQLIETMNGITQTTSKYGMSLREQIDLTTRMSSAFQVMGLSGMMAARDINDMFINRASRTIGGQRLFAGMPEELAKLDNAATPFLEKIKLIDAATEKYLQAGLHANEVLSNSWATLESQVQSALGQTFQPLYDELVTQVMRVREVISGTDFQGVFGGMAKDLQDAAKFAGDLAVALASNRFDLFKDLMSAAFSVAVNEMFVTLDNGVNDIFKPSFQKALVNSLGVFGDTLIDLAFRFGSIMEASLSTVLQKTGFQEGIERVAYDIYADLHPGTPRAPQTGTAKQIDDFYHGVGIGTQDDPYAKKRNAGDILSDRSAENQQQISNFDAMVKSRSGISSLASTNGASSVQAALKSSMDHLADVQIQIANAGQAREYDLRSLITGKGTFGPDGRINLSGGSMGRMNLADMNLSSQPGAGAPPDLTKKDYLFEAQQKIDADKEAAHHAEAMGNEVLIKQANDLVKVDEYRKKLIEDITQKHEVTAEEMTKINQKTAQWAADQALISSRLSGSKDILDQINKAEEAATEARTRVSMIQQDPFTTQLAKRKELLVSYDAEIAALQKVIALDQQAINSGKLKDDNAIHARQKDIDKNNQDIVKARTAASLQTDSGVFMADLTKYADTLGSVGSRAANIITGTLNTAITSTSDNIMKVIQGTETWGQAFQKIGLDIINTIEQMIVKMLIMQAVQSAMGAFGGGGGGAIHLGYGGSIGAQHGGGVIGQDAPTFYRSLPRFHTGGVADDESLAVVKKNESILTPAQVKAISGGGEQTSKNGQPIHLHVINVNDTQSAMKAIGNNPGFLLNEIGKQPAQFRAVLGR